ncbi:class I SAM-dependent methyltransferase [Desulfurispira natronophila]|uniref:16S rRNA (Guanine1207-N2)-methyltransferase n=1 Tax=Desulfurispira natronophila TaxID=682562 RepID=A0A7W7Y474_9BACT|nr:methyltransferase [Desulfurispira natronophila]MBB5021713.1 16S rRNA (guanine1207-N2)-methyltransferase [Desulfurispira natronophila]
METLWCTPGDALGQINTGFALVCKALRKGKLPQQADLHLAWELTQTDGNILVWGYNNQGVRPLEKYCQQKGLPVKSVAVQGRGRAFLIHRIKTSNPFTTGLHSYEKLQYHTEAVEGLEFTYCSLPGVFSHGRIDEGTRFFLQTLLREVRVELKGPLLDLACGSGVLGAAMARLDKGPIHMCDASAVAVKAASGTAICHQLPLPFGSHVYSRVNQRYRTILCNPPFHQGVTTEYHIPEAIICQSRQYLLPGGKLLLVANRFLPYENIAHQVGAQVKKLSEGNGFKVLAISWDRRRG